MLVGDACPHVRAGGNDVAVPVEQEDAVLEARGDDGAVGSLGRKQEATDRAAALHDPTGGAARGAAARGTGATPRRPTAGQHPKRRRAILRGRQPIELEYRRQVGRTRRSNVGAIVHGRLVVELIGLELVVVRGESEAHPLVHRPALIRGFERERRAAGSAQQPAQFLRDQPTQPAPAELRVHDDPAEPPDRDAGRGDSGGDHPAVDAAGERLAARRAEHQVVEEPAVAPALGRAEGYDSIGVGGGQSPELETIDAGHHLTRTRSRADSR